jgi:hypothetical protein
MSTQIDSGNLRRLAEATGAGLDESGWTELQHLQYMLGIWDGIEGHPIVPHELPEWKWEPNDEWRKGQGMLEGHPEHNTTAARRADREWELAHDERKFGPYPKHQAAMGGGLLASDGVVEEQTTNSKPVSRDIGNGSLRAPETVAK